MSATAAGPPGSGSLYKYGTLSLLYFVQGAPYGFQTGCLPLLLRQAGTSFTSLGAMKLLFLPWVCKPLYAPLMESTRTKQWWLLSSVSWLGVTCLYASLATSLHSVTPLLLTLVSLNLASAVQDICVDSLALEILDPGELGAGNMIQVVAYKAGSVFAGAALLWVKEASSWATMWTVFGCLYLLCLVLVQGLGLGYSKKTRMVEEKEEEDARPRLSAAWLVANWRRMLSVPGTAGMVAFVLTYKLCERGEATLPIYLVDKGVPVSSLAFWNGVVRSAASIGGSALSGYLLSRSRVRPRQLMLCAASLRVLPISLQYAVILAWGDARIAGTLGALDSDTLYYALSILCLVAANLCAGLMTTACFTAMMTLSQSAAPRVQTSHYSLLSTMEVLGKLMFASVAGALIDLAGLESVFIVFVILAIATVPLLLRMPNLDLVKPHCDTK